ncbi:hypothetical protein F5B21DRAFT_484545 [Xylaria acuta]|nr:hypothetical protein F5B21DRAFT_484545 [Xylaria acuta]
MWILQTFCPEIGIGAIMGVAMVSGLTTSMLLETALLRYGRDKLSWPDTAGAAAGMSFISMLRMKAAQNMVDYHLTVAQLLLTRRPFGPPLLSRWVPVLLHPFPTTTSD